MWLRSKIWPLESKLTGEICYAGALLGCLEMIRTGTTCFVDMYYFVEDIARAVKESELRCFLSYTLVDLFGEEREKTIRKIAGDAFKKLSPLFDAFAEEGQHRIRGEKGEPAKSKSPTIPDEFICPNCKTPIPTGGKTQIVCPNPKCGKTYKATPMG